MPPFTAALNWVQGIAPHRVALLRLLLLLMLSAASGARAMSLFLEFPQAVGSSAVVAWVEIERGELFSTEAGQSCGARYVARVIHGIKGAAPGERVEFGRFIGSAVGSQYFVFLDESAELLRQTSNAGTATGPAKHAGGCLASLPRYAETSGGLGTIPIKLGDQVGFRPAVTLNGSYGAPKPLVGTKQKTGDIGEGDIHGSVQIEACAFLNYLQSLASTRGKAPNGRPADICL